MEKCCIRIQAIIRGFLKLIHYKFLLFSLVKLQCFVRSALARKSVYKKKVSNASIRLQSCYRTHKCQIYFYSCCFIANCLAKLYRGRIARNKYCYLRVEHKAIIIQSRFRRFFCFRQYKKLYSLVLSLQQLFRSYQARKILKKLQNEARNLHLVILERDKYRQEVLKLRKELDEFKKLPKRMLCSEEELDVNYKINPLSSSNQEEIQSLIQTCQHKEKELEILRSRLNSLLDDDYSASKPNPFLKRIFWRTRYSSLDQSSTKNSNSSPLGTLQMLFKMNSAGKALIFSSPHRTDISSENESHLTYETNTINDSPSHSVISPTSSVSPSVANGTNSSKISTVSQPSSQSTDPIHPFGESANNTAIPEPPPTYVLSSSFSNFARSTIPIHDAVRLQDLAALVEAISSCDDIYTAINTGDHEGKTPLHFCSDIKIASVLLSNLAVSNAQDHSGCTPLHYCSNPSILKLLLSDGAANPNIPNEVGLCALHLAVHRRNIDCVKLLLEFGADPNVQDDVRWFTAFHVIAQAETIENPPSYSTDEKCSLSLETLTVTGQIAKLLCQETFSYKPDLNSQDTNGNTPLHHAAILIGAEACELISIFLQHCTTNPNIKNNRDQTALLLFCHNHDLRKFAFYHEILHLFLKNNANPNISSDKGCTPLHLALFHRDLISAVQLVQSGASLNAPWKKPTQWDSFWTTDSTFTEVIPLDMLSDNYSLHKIISVINQPQPNLFRRSFCMQCKGSISLQKRTFYCPHCGRILCKSCYSLLRRLTLDHFPSSFHALELKNGTIGVCIACEEVLVLKHNTMSEHSHEKEPFTLLNY